MSNRNWNPKNIAPRVLRDIADRLQRDLDQIYSARLRLADNEETEVQADVLLSAAQHVGAAKDLIEWHLSHPFDLHFREGHETWDPETRELLKEGVLAAESRGHDLTGWERYGRTYRTVCVLCDAEVFVHPKPRPGETQVQGQATWWDCPES